MSDTYLHRSTPSLRELVALFLNHLTPEKRNVVLVDWVITLRGSRAAADDFSTLNHIELGEVLKAALLFLDPQEAPVGADGASIVIARSRVANTVLAYGNIVALPVEEPPANTGEIPVVR